MLAARSGEQLKALAERLRSAHQIDVDRPCRRPAQGRRTSARLGDGRREIDILINNAGDLPGGSIDKIDEAPGVTPGN